MEAEQLIHTLPDTPAEAKAEGLGDTLCDMEAEALVDTVAETPIQGNADTFRDSVGNIKAKPSTRPLTTYNQRRPKHTSTHYAN